MNNPVSHGDKWIIPPWKIQSDGNWNIESKVPHGELETRNTAGNIHSDLRNTRRKL